MDYIHYVLNVLLGLFILIVITKIYMGVASYVGEQLGFGKFVIYLWGKIRKLFGKIRNFFNNTKAL